MRASDAVRVGKNRDSRPISGFGIHAGGVVCYQQCPVDGADRI